MIEVLKIKDLALVEELTIEFGAGATVLTGETGAGKSILLQALGLLLGDRASREVVRAGVAQARVEGLFSARGKAAEAIGGLLADSDIPWNQAEHLIITRTVSEDGRSRAQINGCLTPLALLNQVASNLVEFSSQHQHQKLLREEAHLELLDAALDLDGKAALVRYKNSFVEWVNARDEAHRLERLDSKARERAEFLKFQVQEIKAVNLRPGEEEDLRDESKILAHAGKLAEWYGSAEQDLYSGTEAVLDKLGRAAKNVALAVGKDPSASEILELLEEAKTFADEASLGLRERLAALESDPRRADAVEERLAAINRLERKYGADEEAVLALLDKMEKELWELDNMELAIEEARKKLILAEAELGRQAKGLLSARKFAAKGLEAGAGQELESLGMGKSALSVEFIQVPPSPEGFETARFLFAPNPGEPPKPLAKIASGGELSRILLALKNALRDDSAETLLFDEVDAGIGGVAADLVGDRLAKLAKTCQIICVTHLSQIAGKADHHMKVSKREINGRTRTEASILEGAERMEELARMLGGRHITDATRAHASELLEWMNK